MLRLPGDIGQGRHASMVEQQVEQDGAVLRDVRSAQPGNPQHVAGRQQQAEMALRRAEHTLDEPGREKLGIGRGVGDAGPAGHGGFLRGSGS
jgi:hypothetical protein